MESNLSKEERQKRIYELRDNFWEGIGKVDKDVLAFLINPSFSGQPAWPNFRQAFKRILTGNSVILATDGLSDEFNNAVEPNNGFGVELYVELNDPDYMKMTLEELKDTWAFQLLYQASLNAAHTGAFRNTVIKYGEFSTEFYDVNVPNNYINNEERVGVLIGIEGKKVPLIMKLNITDIPVLSVTLLTFDELSYIIQNGGNGRSEIVKRLHQASVHNISSINRKSVI